jgi:acetyl esterase/lipase
MDYLEQDKSIDSKKVAVMGHSRLGKAALWAGAQDQRFALVISNNSGAGGTSLARRNFGESVADLNSVFPYWFCEKYSSFSLHPEELPVDMHELVALIAPRPLYIASAQDDKWADPKGEFLSGKYAQAVYSLFNKVGVGVEEWPDVNTPVGDFIGYHVRTGKHDVTAYDWQQYLSFATRHFRNS